MAHLKDKEMIFVFTGPNGAGRRTIADMAGSTLNMKQVLSYTTREKRPNEIEGEDYFFVSRDTFIEAQRNGEFIEVLDIDGYLYGIKSDDVEQLLSRNGCVYLILNRYGAEIIKQSYGENVKRFFIYADKETLIARQKQRGDTDEMIARYMSHYDEEMAYRAECEHAYENLDSSHTIFDVTKVLEQYLQRGLLDLD